MAPEVLECLLTAARSSVGWRAHFLFPVPVAQAALRSGRSLSSRRQRSIHCAVSFSCTPFWAQPLVQGLKIHPIERPDPG